MGGNCAPSYGYQWQQSFDDLSWTDIKDAILPNLEFVAPLDQTTYYRRKVTETISSSVEYSDIAIVLVDALTQTNP
jgi:hypothetical protein